MARASSLGLGDRLPAYRRIVQAVSALVVEGSYEQTTVTDIVRRAGISRKTFYENFSSKDAAMRALVEQALPLLLKRVDLTRVGQTGLGVLAVELAALAETRGHEEATDRAVDICQALRELAGSNPAVEVDAVSLCSLPPGRHGLPRKFVHSNHRLRLLIALANAVDASGYLPLTLADVTSQARVSRRTFYEHFDSKASLAIALVNEATQIAPVLLEGARRNSGLWALAIEVVAAGVSRGSGAAVSRVVAIEEALYPIVNAGLERAA